MNISQIDLERHLKQPPVMHSDRITRGLDLNPPTAIDRSGDAPKVICASDRTNVIPTADGWQVASQSDPAKLYTVDRIGQCTCPDSAQKQMICKHAWACFVECALLIYSLRAAATITEADEVMDFGTAWIEAAPLGIRRTIFKEYHDAVWALMRQQRAEAA